MDDREQAIQDIICEATGYEWDDMKPTDSLMQDLALDSLDFAQMELDVEERLGVRLAPDAFANVETLEDLMAKLKSAV